MSEWVIAFTSAHIPGSFLFRRRTITAVHAYARFGHGGWCAQVVLFSALNGEPIQCLKMIKHSRAVLSSRPLPPPPWPPWPSWPPPLSPPTNPRVHTCHQGSASRDVIVVDPSEKKRLGLPSTAAPDTPPNRVELCRDMACSCWACAWIVWRATNGKYW